MWAETVLDCSQMSRGQRLEVWHDWIEHLFGPVDVAYRNETSVEGRFEIASIGELTFIAAGTAISQSVYKRAQHIRKAKGDMLAFMLRTEGKTHICQADRKICLRPGEAAFLTNLRPYELHGVCRTQMLELLIPMHLVTERLPRPELFVGRKLARDNTVGHLISTFIRELPHVLVTAKAADREKIQGIAIDLICSAALECLCEESVTISSSGYEKLLRAKRHIIQNLHSPKLDRSTVALTLGLSVRELNRLFGQEMTSVSGYIRQERLARADALLSNPHSRGLKISEIAHRCGFSDSGQFTRLYRKVFGITPTERRRSVTAQTTAHLHSKPRSASCL